MYQTLYLGEGRPAPTPDKASAPFFQGLKEGQLRVQRCEVCHSFQLARSPCFACGADSLAWVEATGCGTLYALAEVFANTNPAFNRGQPYNIAIVELDEGPQIYANVVNAAADLLKIGLRLKLVCSMLSTGDIVPIFEPLVSQVGDGQNS